MQTGQFTHEENVIFWKNLFLVGIFFLITPITLAISLFSIFSLKTSAIAKAAVPQVQVLGTSTTFSGIQVYASLPAKPPSISGEVGSGDARVIIIKNYLRDYNSPLLPYADDLIKNSDKYNLDYRLLPAIAQQESNLCKIIPPDSHNCWGWGIHSQGSLAFNTYPESIETVAKGLRTQYLDKGYNTVMEIMSKYNPKSPNEAWGKGVAQFMSDME